MGVSDQILALRIRLQRIRLGVWKHLQVHVYFCFHRNVNPETAWSHRLQGADGFDWQT